MQSRLILLLLLITTCVCADEGAQISGRASVIDGDGLEIAGVPIRLFGIDAFEGRQTCTRNGQAWTCGEAATERLQQLVGNGTVACSHRDTDQYDRMVAVCTVGGKDLSGELALAGLALAYRQYSQDYVDEEAQAKAARRGAWAGEFQEPWDYRRNPQAVSTTRTTPAPGGQSPQNGQCLIKGNINSQGERIYHTQRSPNYEQTRIDTSRGERWFCTEEEARAAGWRAPRG